MKQNYRLLFELSLNSRIRRKELCTRLAISPQLLNYLFKKIEKKRLLQYCVKTDPAKFGLINIAVLIAFTSFESKNRVLESLKSNDYVFSIKELTHGADLLVEYAVPNLSFFNKLHTAFLELYWDKVKVLDIVPIIVKHVFPIKYLYAKSKLNSKKIYSGDREMLSFSNSEKLVLKELLSSPQISHVGLAQKTKLNIRTVLKTINRLEKINVIKDYSIIPSISRLNISSCIVFVNLDYLEPGRVDKFISYVLNLQEVTSAYKLMGRHALFLEINSLKSYKPVLNKIRDEFKFYDYLLYDVKEIIKDDHLPLEVLG